MNRQLRELRRALNGNPPNHIHVVVRIDGNKLILAGQVGPVIVQQPNGSDYRIGDEVIVEADGIVRRAVMDGDVYVV